MTVPEARQLLGDDISDMTDADVTRMIAHDSELVDVMFSLYEKKLLTFTSERFKNEGND